MALCVRWFTRIGSAPKLFQNLEKTQMVLELMFSIELVKVGLFPVRYPKSLW